MTFECLRRTSLPERAGPGTARAFESRRTTFVAASLLVSLMVVQPALGRRTTASLDGMWEIAESLAPDAIPQAFTHRVPVPGLANLSEPPFPDVDEFDSRETISNRVRRGKLPKSALVSTAGVPRQNRNYFWYRKKFTVPE